MSPTPRTDAVAHLVSGTTIDDIPPEVRARAASHVLDTLASMVACRDLEPAQVARRYALASSGSGSGAPILGTHDRASLVDAVFASAMAGHGAEINDFVPSVFVQPGPSIVSAALTLAADRGASGAELLRAVVVGYELAVRVPRALGVGNLRRAGVANHGIGPVFGTAAACAAVAGLPSAAIGDVVTCCVQQASGSWQWLLDVEHIEKSLVFAGIGARNGLSSVLLVEAGFRGVRDALDRPGTWFTSPPFTGGDAEPDALEDFGALGAMEDCATKRYPVGGPTQPAVEALLALTTEVDTSQVVAVEIAMPGRWEAFRDAAMPALNLRYLAALVLVDGRLDFVSAQSLDRMHGDRDVQALMEIVDVVHDPAQESGAGRDRTESARVTFTLGSGREIERFVPFVRGFPSHPMTADDIDDKARELVEPHLGPARAAEVLDACHELEHLEQVVGLVDLIAR